MPRLSLDNLKSLTEVVYDVKSPHVSIPRAGCRRPNRYFLWRLLQPNQSNATQAPPADAYCRSILCTCGKWLVRQGSEMGSKPFKGRSERLGSGRIGRGHAFASRLGFLLDHTGRRTQRSDDDHDRLEGGVIRSLRYASPRPSVHASGDRGSGSQYDRELRDVCGQQRPIGVSAGGKRANRVRRISIAGGGRGCHDLFLRGSARRRNARMDSQPLFPLHPHLGCVGVGWGLSSLSDIQSRSRGSPRGIRA